MIRSTAFLILSLVFLTSPVYGLVDFRAAGRATSITASPFIQLPAGVVNDDAVFSLNYSVDETLAGSNGTFDGVVSFNGFVGDNIAFGGSGGQISFQNNGNVNVLSGDFDASSIVLQGIAADLLSVDTLSFDVPISNVLPGTEFPTYSPALISGETTWTFGGTDGDGASIMIQGIVDSLIVVGQPDNGNGDPDNGMNGGGDMNGGGGGDPDNGMNVGGDMNGGGGGDPDNGMSGGGGMNGGGGNGAIPEPASVAVWGLLLGLAGGIKLWSRPRA